MQLNWVNYVLQSWTVCASVGSANNISKFSLYFSGSCIPTNESLLITMYYTFWVVKL